MRTLILKLVVIAVTLSVTLTGCKKNDDPDLSEFIGDFVISNAELAEALTVPTVESEDFTVPAGTNITVAIQTALLSAVSCSSADKSYVELREDFSMYLSCEGLNPLNAGTWEEVSATSIKLNMNATAIPPIGFVLMVTDVVKDASGLTGMASVPLTKEMIAGILAQIPLTLSPTAPDIFLVEILLEFIEK